MFPVFDKRFWRVPPWSDLVPQSLRAVGVFVFFISSKSERSMREGCGGLGNTPGLARTAKA
jgi:hypothetical protein